MVSVKVTNTPVPVRGTVEANVTHTPLAVQGAVTANINSLPNVNAAGNIWRLYSRELTGRSRYPLRVRT